MHTSNALPTLRKRYTRLFVTLLLCSAGWVLYQSGKGGLQHFEDNLPGRPALIAGYVRLRLKAGDRVFSQVLVGQDGWLNYSASRNLDDYQNVIHIPQDALENTRQKIQVLYDRLRERNITLILVIPPNKASIYPDKLPAEIQKIGGQSRLDAFTDLMRRNGPPVLVDLRPGLEKARKKYDVYYRTDSHWNAYGAYWGYKQIMTALSKTDPGLSPDPLSSYTLVTGPPISHDLALLMGSSNILENTLALVPAHNSPASAAIYNDDSGIPLTVTSTAQARAPRLLMYMDSFGVRLQDFLAPDFSRATFVRWNTAYPDLLTFETIDTFKPDVVIVEMVERSFSIQLLDGVLDHLLQNSGT